jgi:hypothetical protein
MAVFRCNACKGTYSDTMRDGTVYMHVCGPLPPDDDGVERERPDKRDENPRTPRTERTTEIRSEGAGVTCISDPKLSEPAWLTRLKAKIAKEEEG